MNNFLPNAKRAIIEPIMNSHPQLMIRPINSDENLLSWVKENRNYIQSTLLSAGGILFRGFPNISLQAFESVMEEITPVLEEYNERSTPRSEVKGKIYSSTEYPADQRIPMHNENSYAHTWPLKIWFHCVQVAIVGGETPIADSRKVYQLIDPSIRKRFAEKKVLYVRNMGGEYDLPWQTVFQTDNPNFVNEYCRQVGIEVEWNGTDRIRTKSTRSAIAKHPITGEDLWFNQAHLFHISSLQPEIREYLVDTLGEENLPRNVYYGDGSKIEDSVLDEIREVYDEVSLTFPWENGDILLLDNMLNTHGRNTFTGMRKIVVAMAEPWKDYGI
ncbi:taurine catabolism dioxygenase TauD [Paenibacillus selenitireducens]|uniref:Taurine catabolism dioxygenase TauD n=1 Tax=Paenibacillus selenitireducens TaxID=1324314 RepID=A0A1T2XL51_9BACL|nr:TauD/TfdA family dioxygenase [Paenibacillus selenitireducens]OPA80599.1 taurine catabolism dioxygenase TauD [Paenibacillus selenitireducens]